MKTACSIAAAALAALLTTAAAAVAQIHATLVAQGFSQPIAFVQDPTMANVQYVVEQGGHIAVLVNGVRQAQDFLDLSGEIDASGERGLLGMAFAPDYATSGRLFVNFTNPDGNTVIARFLRSAGDPLRADAGSEFDLLWPDGNRYITQPFPNHNGGNLAFGPDGYLYIGMGDGGDANDPFHNAQNPASLLGKMLRINVSVSALDPEGYDVPGDNPFLGMSGYLGEIWAFGLRNPWRYSFDPVAQGGTDALIIGDVGQGAWEEIDYEPADSPRRNYGWRNREGAHANVMALPPAYMPLVDPTWEYDHTVGKCITGGVVYRGSRLPAQYVGKYFFADYITQRVWMMGFVINPSTGEASAGTVTDITAQLGNPGSIVSFGRDAAGEVYLVDYDGHIYRIDSDVASDPAIFVDTPTSGPVAVPFAVAGWAIDRGAPSGAGVDKVHVWAVPSGAPAILLGQSGGLDRPDVAAAYGAQFRFSGFRVTVSSLAARHYQLIVYAHSTVTQQFDIVRVLEIDVQTSPRLRIDTPTAGGSFRGRVRLAGWAIDERAATGTGVDAVHVWAVPGSGPAQVVGAASYGQARGDVGSVFGARFTNSGWSLTVAGLAPGAWTLVAYARSTFTGSFDAAMAVPVTLTDGLLLQADTPAAMQTVPTSGAHVAGWALDLAATTGTGVNAVHVWAIPVGAGTAVFVGAATIGLSRPDVGAAFGGQFTPSGYDAPITLAPGTYDLIVYARRSSSGSFDAARVVRIVVQ